MLGIFDSGAGGLSAFATVRHSLRREDIIYLADRKNSPYGKKTEEELIRLVSRDVERLSRFGCRRVLIACCTASTVYPHLKEEYRSLALPIITPAARAAGGGRVTVIATEHTVKARAFTKEILQLYPNSDVTELAAQELVSLVEGGCRDGKVTERGEKVINKVIGKISETHPDALLLGCTHFSHLAGFFSAALPGVRIVDSAKTGALALIGEINERKERGVSLYTE